MKKTTYINITRTIGLGLGLTVLAASGCTTNGEPKTPNVQVVVSTNILADVVQNIAGDEVQVTGLMPPGADPHSFQLSAQQANTLENAPLIIYNGLGLEGGLLHNIEAAIDAGAIGFAVAEHVNPIAFAEGSPEHTHDHEEEHDDHDHGDEEHSHDADEHDHADEDATEELGHDHDHSHETDGDDPHFWNDPHRMMTAVELIADEIIAHIPGIDEQTIRNNAAAYLVELEELDEYLHDEFDSIPAANRKLITNHAVFGYLANAYGFEVIGTIIPGGTTLAEPSAAELSELVHLLEETGLNAIFAETSQPTKLAETLATEVGHGVQVISLYSESLSEPGSEADSYLKLMRYNGDAITAALR